MEWTVDGVTFSGAFAADYAYDANNDVSTIGVSGGSGNDTCLAGITFDEGTVIEAGVYPCNGNVPTPPLVNIQVGVAGTAFYNHGAALDCTITLDEDVIEGGPVRGSFEGNLVNISNASDTIDVTGTFDFPSSI
jgi:hypothetical protein